MTDLYKCDTDGFSYTEEEIRDCIATVIDSSIDPNQELGTYQCASIAIHYLINKKFINKITET